jgi:hypothetical protein
MMKITDNISDKNPFKVPENYFEEVNERIISSTSGNNSGTVKRGFFHILKPYLLIAASVTGFIILGYSAVKLFSPYTMSQKVSEAIYNDFNELYINDIDILTLEENAASLLFSEGSTGVNKSDIIDYLLLENIEINEIYAQL